VEAVTIFPDGRKLAFGAPPVLSLGVVYVAALCDGSVWGFIHRSNPITSGTPEADR
jgi:hypothetical protein